MSRNQAKAELAVKRSYTVLTRLELLQEVGCFRSYAHDGSDVSSSMAKKISSSVNIASVRHGLQQVANAFDSLEIRDSYGWDRERTTLMGISIAYEYLHSRMHERYDVKKK